MFKTINLVFGKGLLVGFVFGIMAGFLICYYDNETNPSNQEASLSDQEAYQIYLKSK